MFKRKLYDAEEIKGMNEDLLISELSPKEGESEVVDQQSKK